MALIVKTNIAAAVKDISKKKGYKVASISEDFIAAADEKVRKLVEDAVERAQSNGRRTIMGRDL